MIFIAEWCDLTQIATASLYAHYHESPWTIFTAATLALWTVTAIAVFVGHKVKHLIHGEKLKKLSVLVFTLVGSYFIYAWLLTFHIKPLIHSSVFEKSKGIFYTRSVFTLS